MITFKYPFVFLIKMNSLNIGLLSYCRPHLGGSGIMTMELAKALIKKGHNVTLISYPGTFLTKEESDLGLKLEKIYNVDYDCFKAEPYSEIFMSLISNLAMSGKIDLIHSNYAITHGTAANNARDYINFLGKKIATIVTNHGSDIHTNGHHKFLSSSIESTLLKADEITFVSNALKEEAYSLFPLIKGKGTTIYNFVDTEKFVFNQSERESIRDKLNIPHGAFVVYHASNFRDIKNIDYFSVLANMDKNNDRPFYFVMLGDGPEKTRLEDKVSINYNLNEQFRFMGKKDNVTPYINASDVALLPSKRESFGLVLLEAMSCGLPVVGSNVGGISEVISHEENGFLFDLGDFNSLYNYLSTLRNNSNLCKIYGLKSVDFAKNKFSIESIVNQYEQIYEKALRGE